LISLAFVATSLGVTGAEIFGWAGFVIAAVMARCRAGAGRPARNAAAGMVPFSIGLALALAAGLSTGAVFLTAFLPALDLLFTAAFFDNLRSLAVEFLARVSVFALATFVEAGLAATGLLLAVGCGTPLAFVVPAVPLAVVTSTFFF
jgi:hypothetical protein